MSVGECRSTIVLPALTHLSSEGMYLSECGVLGHIVSQDRTVRHERPALFGVAVTLACRGEVGPRKSGGIQHGNAFIKLASQEVAAVWQDRRRRVSDTPQPWGGFTLVQVSFTGSSNRAQVGEGKLVVVVFAAFNNQAAIGQNGGSEGIGHISGGQAGNSRPGSLDVAS